MSTNPGYYVAAITCSGGGAEMAVKYTTLLQPDDSLHIGQSYRLVSFEEFLGLAITTEREQREKMRFHRFWLSAQSLCSKPISPAI
ncbi:hypothetical protein KFK09_009164 [Dendrobium nobile]|uniref:Uncharacterized protein n=1 Tax=Dendrobium nobile TaxID=94219 RepID=A0A8T3BPN5_DENNO|nr:hypothetical protein KFK09_009164 [Dendrobium nobile]